MEENVSVFAVDRTERISLLWDLLLTHSQKGCNSYKSNLLTPLTPPPMVVKVCGVLLTLLTKFTRRNDEFPLDINRENTTNPHL